MKLRKPLKPRVPDGLFIHIAKTGGSSIRKSGVIGQHPKFYCSQNRHIHTHSRAIKKQVGNKNWHSMFKFCFVRNPYDRLVSFYHYITTKNATLSSLRMRKRAIGERSFKEFCFMFNKNEVLRKSPGVQRQCAYITDKNNQIMVDYIGRFENFQQDWDYLCKNVFRHKYVLPHKNHSNHRHYLSYYDDETKQVVSDYYEKDFEMFEYDKLLT